MALSELLGKSLIDMTNGNMYILDQTSNDKVIIVELDNKDLDILGKYMELSRTNIKLKRKPKTDEEREFRRCYNHLYSVERSAKAAIVNRSNSISNN